MALLDEDDIERLAKLIANRPPVTPCADNCVYKSTEAHDKSHAILDRWIENDTKRNARNEKIKATVIGSLVLGAAGSIGTGALAALTYIKEHWK